MARASSSARLKALRQGGWRQALRALWRRLRGGAVTPLRAGSSVALGVFIGCIPVFGLHFPLCAALCLPLRLDLVLCYLGSNISNPLFAPLLILAELKLGAWLLGRGELSFDRAAPLSELMAQFGVELLVGAPLVGLALGLCLGALSAAVVHRRRQAAPLPVATKDSAPDD